MPTNTTKITASLLSIIAMANTGEPDKFKEKINSEVNKIIASLRAEILAQ